MEEQKMNKINEQEAEVINDGNDAQKINEDAAKSVHVEILKKNKKAKIIGLAIGGTAVVGLTVAGIVYYVRKGQVSKARQVLASGAQAIPELAQSAMANAPEVVGSVSTDAVLEATAV